MLKQYKWTLLIGSLALILFLILRLIRLDNLPVFVDEAIYVRWAQVMKNEPTLRFLPLSDGKQPLAMWSTIPFFKLVSDPLVAGRLVSVCAGLGTMVGVSVLTYLFTRKTLTSAVSALLYAILPFTVFFDRMALADAMLSMFGIWSLVFGYLFITTLRLDAAMLLGFAIGGGMLTKSPAIFFYLWQLVLSLLFFRPVGKQLFRPLFKLFGGWLVATIISQAIFSVLRLGPGFSMIGSRNQDYLYTIGEALSHPLVPLITNLRSTTDWIWSLVTLPVILLILISLTSKWKKYALTLLLISLASLFGQAFIAKVYTSRYILFTIPPLVVAAALGLAEIKNKKITILTSSLLVFPALLAFIYAYDPEKVPNMPYDMYSGYLQEWTAGTGQKQFADYLIDQASQGHKIVVGTDGYFGTLPDGLQIYTEGNPNITVIGVGLPINRIPPALVNTSSNNQIYLVLNKSRNQLDPNSLAQLKLISEYPKAIRNNGTREVLQVYRLQK